MCLPGNCEPGCPGWKSLASNIIAKRSSGILTKIFSQCDEETRRNLRGQYLPQFNFTIVNVARKYYIENCTNETIADWCLLSFGSVWLTPTDRRCLLAHLEYLVTRWISTSEVFNFHLFLPWPASLDPYLLPVHARFVREEITPHPRHFVEDIPFEVLNIKARAWLSVNERKSLFPNKRFTLFDEPMISPKD